MQAPNLSLEESMLAGIAKFEKVTDISRLKSIFDRYLKTSNLKMKIFLANRMAREIHKLELRFPIVPTSPSSNNIISDVIETKEFIVGDLILSDGAAVRYGLSREDLNRGILVSGSTGHGKTSLVMNIMNKISMSGVKYTIFDMKRDYLTLASDENTIYLDDTLLRVNPFEAPSGVSDLEWLRHFSDIFSNSFSLMIGSRDFLLENLLKFSNEVKASESRNLRSFLKFLEQNAIRNEYYKVTTGRIRSLLSSCGVFDCASGISFSRLDNYNLILGIDRLGIPEQNFLVSFVLSYLYYLNINKGEKRGSLHRLVVIDDAHTILDANKDKDYAMGIPILHSIISKIRELGIGFLFSDQQVSSLMSSVIQNTNIKFIGRSNSVKELEMIFSSRSASDLSGVALNLGKGEFLLLSQDVSPYAMFKADRINIAKVYGEDIIEVNKFIHADLLDYKKITETDDGIDLLNAVAKAQGSELSDIYKSLTDRYTYAILDSQYSALVKNGSIGELRVRVDNNRAARFPYLKKGASPSSKTDFERSVLKNLVKSTLSNFGLQYEEDDAGILVHGLDKIYVAVSPNSTDLKRLLETRFSRVIAVFGDYTNKENVIAGLIGAAGKMAVVNLNILKVFSFLEFKNEWAARLKSLHK